MGLNSLKKKRKRRNVSHKYFDDRFQKGLIYARQLTQAHSEIEESDIEELRKCGFSDGEILEINQVACYFNYVNRIVVGLGVTLEGDILGLSPSASSDPNDWSHK